MSYILDALKKSDQERQQQEGPTLQTIQRPVRKTARAGRWALVVASLAILVAIAVVLSLWWYRPAPTVAPATAVPASQDSPGNAAAATADKTPAATNSSDEPEAGEMDYADNASPTVAFGDLPDNIRNQVPALTFSFHVYSDKPESRTIIINNRRVREGDNVLQNLQLLEITPQGVVLQWKGHPFFINVVDNW